MMAENVVLIVTPLYLQTSKEDLVMPSGVSTDGDNYEGATVIVPEKGYYRILCTHYIV